MTTQTITIQGHEFTAPSPYTEGYTLKPNEASALNQVLGENLRNNFAGKVKAAMEEAQKNGGQVDLTALQTEFDAYAAEYEFGARRSGGGGGGLPKDPVERMAHTIAREKIREMAKSKGKKLSPEQIAGLVPQLLEKNPSIRDLARQRVEDQKAISIEELELPEAEVKAESESGGEGGTQAEDGAQAEAQQADARSRRRRG